MTNLTQKEINEICNEIEMQWEYHLMTRAVFHSKISESDDYSSPSFYSSRGFDIQVKLPNKKSESFQRAAKGIGSWLNQNYVIRLYGILDSKQIMKIGKEDSDIIKLINILRMNIGAHSTGRKVSKKDDLDKATRLINNLFNLVLSVDVIKSYVLSVDSVLEPMKNKTMEYVKSLEIHAV